MTPISWHAAYYSELQSLWALLVVPVAFLAWRLAAPCDSQRAVVPAAARFVSLATLIFAFQTMLDPIATGAVVKSEVLRDTFVATLVPFLFVYLGDLRVLLVAFAVARPDAPFGRTLGLASAATAIVPLATGILYAGLRGLWPEAHSQWLWMIYEAGFLGLCVVATRIGVPRAMRRASADGGGSTDEASAFLAALFGYSAAYYALWLAADLLIVAAGLELGWALRMVPNQLYYAIWTPFVYFRFFSAPPPNAAR